MSGNAMAAMVAVIVAGVLAFGLWYQNAHPRRIVSTSSIGLDSRKAGGGRMTLATRTVQVGDRQFQEVEMPNGTWIDCAGDCRKAAYEAGEGFWETRAREGR